MYFEHYLSSSIISNIVYRMKYSFLTFLVIFLYLLLCTSTSISSGHNSDRLNTAVNQCKMLGDTATLDDNETKYLKLITYNVLYGGDGCGDDRLQRLQRWFRNGSQDAAGNACASAPRYDFAAFNEANGWHRNLQQVAEGFGFPHCALLEARTGFHIAFMSRHPFESVAHTDPPFHHGPPPPPPSPTARSARHPPRPQACSRSATGGTTSPSS